MNIVLDVEERAAEESESNAERSICKATIESIKVFLSLGEVTLHSVGRGGSHEEANCLFR